jgi:putative ATP-dependent endonuclease of OLD family
MVKLSNVRVEGFRLLDRVDMTIEPATTVIVGRNNSGKTSLTEVFDKFLGEQAGLFRLEDFSSAVRANFVSAKAARDSGATPAEAVLALLPRISLTLTFKYDGNEDDLGPLSPFIIDLDPDCTTAIAVIEYSCSLNKISVLLDILNYEADGENSSEILFRHLRDAIPKAYSIKCFAKDPTDETNVRAFDSAGELKALLQTGFVKAQRTLDKGKRGDTDVIGRLLSKLFKTADNLNASPVDQEIASQLKAAVAEIEMAIQGDFDDQLRGLLPALNTFGFPSLNDTELRPQTEIDVESLLTDNTRILYNGVHGVHLPEGYNGLGTRNLIYILLQLEALHKAYRSTPVRPVTNLVFIEEPEAHLHPQMQEVFISQLSEAVSSLSERYPDEPTWQVQFIVSTHSSHLANAAPFDAIRYFLNEPTDVGGVRRTKIKDFRKGANAITPADRSFLQQYMTLTKCDLYFADKAILVEGATEKILMPRIIKLVDETLSADTKLGRQYITTMEVGGAHAQIFYPLLDFLEIKSLIITDIDGVTLDNGKWRKCPCSLAERTSNNSLKTWFGDTTISVAALVAKSTSDKMQNYRRIAYQMPEDGSHHCARSYEDALILANLDRFGIANDEHAASNAFVAAQDFKKSEEAIRFAIVENDWAVPKYIREGLVWLSEPPPPPPPLPVISEVNEIGVAAE